MGGRGGGVRKEVPSRTVSIFFYYAETFYAEIIALSGNGARKLFLECPFDHMQHLLSGIRILALKNTIVP